eukprot:scaffold572_cov229-Amphora_coffeaeformis.AAC.1
MTTSALLLGLSPRTQHSHHVGIGRHGVQAAAKVGVVYKVDGVAGRVIPETTGHFPYFEEGAAHASAEILADPTPLDRTRASEETFQMGFGYVSKEEAGRIRHVFPSNVSGHGMVNGSVAVLVINRRSFRTFIRFTDELLEQISRASAVRNRARAGVANEIALSGPTRSIDGLGHGVAEKGFGKGCGTVLFLWQCRDYENNEKASRQAGERYGMTARVCFRPPPNAD